MAWMRPIRRLERARLPPTQGASGRARDGIESTRFMGLGLGCSGQSGDRLFGRGGGALRSPLDIVERPASGTLDVDRDHNTVTKLAVAMTATDVFHDLPMYVSRALARGCGMAKAWPVLVVRGSFSRFGALQAPRPPPTEVSGEPA